MLFIFCDPVDGFQGSSCRTANGTPPFRLTSFSLPVTFDLKGGRSPHKRAAFEGVSSVSLTIESITKNDPGLPVE